MTNARPLVIRFWEKVETGSGCWLWRGTIKGGRYGVLNRGGKKDGQAYAHRVAWELTNGPIPPGMDVCHACDNPPCVRPDHLFVGTRADNMADMKRKGRHRFGEGHQTGRLTDAQAREILRRALAGEPPGNIGVEFGVSASHVENIRRGHRWSHLPGRAA